MSYNLDPISDGCYPGTNTLINKLNIHDECELLKVEALTTYMKMSNLEINALKGEKYFYIGC